MAEYIVDEFRVKRSGLFQPWRGIRIYVSDGGVVRTEDTTSDSINLDNLQDYKSSDRRYGPGNLITKFCNLDTFTQYTVTATDTRPFVVVTDSLNSTECGYQTPLPQPHVPFNPFGNPNYKEYRRLEYCDIEGILCIVSIEKKDYTGDSLPIEVAGGSPAVLKYTEVDNKFSTIRPAELQLNLIEASNFELEEFYTEDERTFRVTHTKNGQINFRGYIIPDSCREDFRDGNNIVSVKCTDSIQSLKTVSYPIPTGSTFDLKQSFIGVLCYCLSPTNLNLDIRTVCNLYADNMPNSINDDPLDLSKINPLRLVDDKGATLTCFEVLEEVCKAWGMYVVQSDGAWNFIRFNELALEIVRQRTYNYTGLRLVSQNLFNKRLVGGPLK